MELLNSGYSTSKRQSYEEAISNSPYQEVISKIDESSADFDLRKQNYEHKCKYYSGKCLKNVIEKAAKTVVLLKFPNLLSSKVWKQKILKTN